MQTISRKTGDDKAHNVRPRENEIEQREKEKEQERMREKESKKNGKT